MTAGKSRSGRGSLPCDSAWWPIDVNSGGKLNWKADFGTRVVALAGLDADHFPAVNIARSISKNAPGLPVQLHLLDPADIRRMELRA
jgi:hypothetical protein